MRTSILYSQIIFLAASLTKGRKQRNSLQRELQGSLLASGHLGRRVGSLFIPERGLNRPNSFPYKYSSSAERIYIQTCMESIKTWAMSLEWMERPLAAAARASTSATAATSLVVVRQPPRTWSSACRALEEVPGSTDAAFWGACSAAPVVRSCGRTPRTRKPCRVAVCARNWTRGHELCGSETPTNSAAWKLCSTRCTGKVARLRSQKQSSSYR